MGAESTKGVQSDKARAARSIDRVSSKGRRMLEEEGVAIKAASAGSIGYAPALALPLPLNRPCTPPPRRFADASPTAPALPAAQASGAARASAGPGRARPP